MSHIPFTFDTRFDDPAGRRDRDPKRPRHTEDALRAAVAAAREEGRRDGLAEAATGSESLTAIALDRTAAGLEVIARGQAEMSRELEQTACRLAAEFLGKFAPEYARRMGLDEVVAILRDCLAELREEPRVVLRVAVQRMEAIQDLVEPIKAKAAFPGEVILLSDDSMGPGDCLVEWADGGALRDANRFSATLDRAVERILSASADSAGRMSAPAQTAATEARE